MPRLENMQVVALQLDNLIPYKKNLDKLIEHISSHHGAKLIVAPEVCLTDYDYDNLEKAIEFSKEAIDVLTDIVDEQIVVLTVLCRAKEGYTNDAIVIHKHQIVHRQSKHKLFTMGEEEKYLKAGDESGIKIFEIDGVKYGLMICFELRFKELWRRLEGADVVLLPSQWGMSRKKHLEILPQALAIMNQCYVVVANSSKESMASSSAIYSPSGGVVIDDMQEFIESEIDFRLIKKIRRYIVMR